MRYERERACIWRYKFRTIYCVGGNIKERVSVFDKTNE